MVFRQVRQASENERKRTSIHTRVGASVREKCARERTRERENENEHTRGREREREARKRENEGTWERE